MDRTGLLNWLLPSILLFASVGGLAYSPHAQAQQYQCTSSSPRLCDEGQASAEAWAYARDTASKNPSYGAPCVLVQVRSFVGFAASGTCAGGRIGTQTFYWEGACKDRQPNHKTSIWSQLDGPSGSMGCMDGCHAIHTKDPTNGTPTNYFAGSDTCNIEPDCSALPGSTLNRLTWTCDSPEPSCPNGAKPNSLGKCGPEPCPDGKVQQPDGTCKNKNNECPAGQIKSPDGKCLPGDGQCASGEVRGGDGTCKKDKDGDGKPDPGEEGGEDSDGKKKDEFSGGDDCKSPPSCSGSPIMCGQARIQWRIDCNTRKNRNIAGGHCGQAPICTGEKCDALEYSGLLMQWRTACAVEKLGQGGTGDSGLKDYLTAESRALRALGQDDGHGGVDVTKIWASADSEKKVNPGLFGSGGGSCNLSFTIGGEVVSPPGEFWRLVSIIHWLLIASTYVWVAYQLTR